MRFVYFCVICFTSPVRGQSWRACVLYVCVCVCVCAGVRCHATGKVCRFAYLSVVLVANSIPIR